MFCKKCGCEIDDDSLFCVNCGANVAKKTDENKSASDVKLMKAQCPNCGGNLELDPKRYKATCPYCNTPFMVAQAIRLYQTINKTTYNNNVVVANPTVNVTSGMDADTMFENWLAINDYNGSGYKLAKQFYETFTTDPRNRYITLKKSCWGFNTVTKSALREYESLIDRYITGPRFGKYRSQELNFLRERLNYFSESEKKAEIEQFNTARSNRIEVVQILVLIIGIIIFVLAVGKASIDNGIVSAIGTGFVVGIVIAIIEGILYLICMLGKK